jgi:hypothetical protein
MDETAKCGCYVCQNAMNVARSHDLPFSRYFDTKAAAFFYGLVEGGSNSGRRKYSCALKVVPIFKSFYVSYALVGGIEIRF